MTKIINVDKYHGLSPDKQIKGEQELEPSLAPASNNLAVIEQKSSFKLIKNTKGYQWEIKVVDDDISVLIRQAEILDNTAKQKWGNKDGSN